MAILQSVNIGAAQPIPGKSSVTGIFKHPAEGKVEIGLKGLEGDAIVDRKHHGGVDQAVYAYFADDYDYWAKQGLDIEPGLFGENLTIGGVEGRAVAVGDRFALGSALLEVTSHRTPCAVFAARMGDPGWVKRFHKAGRPGAYMRVIATGAVETGMPVKVTPFEGERITMAQLMALDGEREIDPNFMRRALTTPVHYKMRADFEDRLARLF